MKLKHLQMFPETPKSDLKNKVKLKDRDLIPVLFIVCNVLYAFLERKVM